MAFILSKIIWMLTTPAMLIVVAWTVGYGLEQWGKCPQKKRRGRYLHTAALCLTLAILFLPVGDWTLFSLEGKGKAYSPPLGETKINGIILLGGDETPALSAYRDWPVSGHALGRYLRVVELARAFPEAPIIFAGGSGRLSPSSTALKESDVAKKALEKLGIPAQRLLIEDQSRNTYENAILTKKLINPPPNTQWILVTSAWHMPRARATFETAGWNVIPLAGDYNAHPNPPLFSLDFTEQLAKLTLAMHEYGGLLYYRLRGWL